MNRIRRRIPQILTGLLLAVASAVPVTGMAEGFAEAMVAARKRADPPSARVDALTRTFPVESDWFTQCAARPQVNHQGRSKALLKYLAKDGGDREFLLAAVTGVLAESGVDDQGIADRFANLPVSGTDAHELALLHLFEQACTRRRTARLKTVVAEYPKFLFIKRIPVRPSFYAYTEGQSDGQTERHFHPRSSLCLLDMSSGKPVVTPLLEDPTGVIRDLDVSFDAQKALFSWKKGPAIETDDYHLYEMDLNSRGIRQLTYTQGVADYEGRYLPGGDLVFSSSRCVQTIDCWTTEASNMYTSDPNGRWIRRLGFDQVHTTYPTVLNDGKILYTRWDYNDRGQTFPQPLFQMNPDGTAQTEYYGNNSWFPTTIHHARAIPGSRKILAVLHGHHTWQAGKLALIDREQGTQEAEGVQLVAPLRETRAVKVDQYGQDEELFRHPYPLTETEYISAMTLDHAARKHAHSKFGLYYIDIDGNRELLVYDPDLSCAHPVPVKRRSIPQRASLVDHSKTQGIYYLQDVYEGPGLEGVERGAIEKLRVVALDFRAAPIGNTNSQGEGGQSFNSTPIACGNGSWDPKIILGEVNVHEDGSAMYQVPANTPMYFQCIDQQGQVAATMRSWSTLMPGETLSCVGCHEDKTFTPPMKRTPLAMQAGPQALTPFYDVTGGFSFPRVIQPILDKHCIRCHDGNQMDQGQVVVDLTGQPVHDPQAKRNWSRSYLNLTGVKKIGGGTQGADAREVLNWISSQSRPDRLPAYHRGSATSEIVTLLRGGHGDTLLSREELDKFCAWIDLAVPFCGDYLEANAWTPEEMDRYLRYQRKREWLSTEVRRATEAVYLQQTGNILRLPDPPPRYSDAP